MPGDRIVVYRDPIVRFTVFLDRLAAPFQTVIGTTLQNRVHHPCRQVRVASGDHRGAGAAGAASRAPVTNLPLEPGAR